MKESRKQEIIFVTGKGGVGKSAVAAAIAQQRAQRGQKTLLAELGYQSFFQDYFDLEQVTYKPHPVKSFDLALWSGPESLREYVLHLIKLESLFKLFFENPVSKALVNIAPALPELAVLGKITSGIRHVGPHLDYDCLVIDAYATGHFMALLKAPQGMAETFKVGPMGEQTRAIQKILSNPEICKYVVVSFPEEMPVVEAIELADGIYQQTNVQPVHILNKVWPLQKSPEDPGISKLSKFYKYTKDQEQRQKEFHKQLGAKGFSVQELPFVFDNKAWTIVHSLAGELKI